MSNKNHKPIITPDLLPKISSDITDDSLKYLSSKQQQADFKKSNAYKNMYNLFLIVKKFLKSSSVLNGFGINFFLFVIFLLLLLPLLPEYLH